VALVLHVSYSATSESENGAEV